MKYLLDTHTLLWAAREPRKLSRRAKSLLKDGSQRMYVSAVTAFEMATKVRLGKLEDPTAMLSDFRTTLEEQGYSMVPLTVAHALKAGSFPESHRDPFDRMLAAQALLEGLTLLSIDAKLDTFGVARVW